ncbi:hypothetical protein F4819DRAFT_440363 [Hypoxylon fuscum]|nr:hypothetical protein F4819DRAFT_440363 [Hypoxylon fuscum]
MPDTPKHRPSKSTDSSSSTHSLFGNPGSPMPDSLSPVATREDAGRNTSLGNTPPARARPSSAILGNAEPMQTPRERAASTSSTASFTGTTIDTPTPWSTRSPGGRVSRSHPQPVPFTLSGPQRPQRQSIAPFNTPAQRPTQQGELGPSAPVTASHFSVSVIRGETPTPATPARVGASSEEMPERRRRSHHREPTTIPADDPTRRRISDTIFQSQFSSSSPMDEGEGSSPVRRTTTPPTRKELEGKGKEREK